MTRWRPTSTIASDAKLRSWRTRPKCSSKFLAARAIFPSILKLNVAMSRAERLPCRAELFPVLLHLGGDPLLQLCQIDRGDFGNVRPESLSFFDVHVTNLLL